MISTESRGAWSETLSGLLRPPRGARRFGIQGGSRFSAGIRSRFGAGAIAIVAMLAAAPFLLVGLGTAPFDDPGEGMHAEIARELLVSGDPFALTLNGVRYVDKPPLLYVLLAGSFKLFGPSEWSARLVPALAGLAAIGATAWLGARLLGLRGALVAAGALLSSVGFFAYARYVRPETLMVGALATGVALMLVGIVEGRRPLVAAGLAAFGVAGLAKDPLAALMPPAAIALAFALAGRASALARRIPISGVAAWLALGLGWWVIAALRTPGLAAYTVIDNHILNVLRARRFPDEDVPLSALEFLVVTALAMAPWIIAAAVVVFDLARRRAWRDPDETPWVALALWATGVIALTALSPFRLPHYGLPAAPMLALLAARAWIRGGGRRLVVAHVILFVGVGLACAVGWRSDGTAFMTHVLRAADVATRKREVFGNALALPGWPLLRPLAGATAAVFIGGAVLTAIAGPRQGARSGQALATATVALTMLAALPGVGQALALVAAHRAVQPLALEAARQATPTDTLVHEGPIENSGALEWYAGRRPVIVDGGRSVLAFGATLAGAGEAFWTPERLARAWGDGQRVWLISARQPEASLAARLPGAMLVRAAGGRRLYVNRAQ